MKSNKKNIIIAMFILSLIIACGKKKETVEDNSRPVKVKVLENNNISLGYTASGEFKGIEEVPYTATSDGEIIVLNGKNGDNVSAGQTIVSIDNQSAQSNVLSATATYNEARINFEKYSQLYSKRLVTETDYLSAKTAMDTARANLDLANDNRRKSIIKTSTSGTISNMNLEKHQQVSNGDTLFTVVNESEMKLEVGVSPKVIEKIKIGTEAKIKVDELNGEEVTGVVYEVASAASSSTRQFVVKIKVNNADRKIKSGMYGTVSINTGAEEGIIIPKKSIVVRGVEQIVYMVKEDKAVAIPIKILNQNEEFAAVIGEGLATGAQIIVDGQNVVQASEKVRIVK